MERSHSCANFDASNTAQIGESVNCAAELQHAGSSGNLPMTIYESSTKHFPPNKPLRKKKLQRQKSTIEHDDYAADLEEEADEWHTVAARVPKQQPHQHLHLHQHIIQHQQQYQITPRSQPPSELLLMRHISYSSTSSSNVSSPLRPASSSSCSTTSSSTPMSRFKHEESFDSTSSANAEISPLAQRHHFNMLLRDSSVQSDSSRYSSVDSLLESRKPDPEAILINLGFGPIGSEDILSRIPKRFLKPSQVRGIDTEAFVKRLQLASSLADSSVMGYRGLIGNPDMPPSSIVAKIMQRFEVNHRKKSMGSIEHSI